MIGSVQTITGTANIIPRLELLQPNTNENMTPPPIKPYKQFTLPWSVFVIQSMGYGLKLRFKKHYSLSFQG